MVNLGELFTGKPLMVNRMEGSGMPVAVQRSESSLLGSLSCSLKVLTNLGSFSILFLKKEEGREEEGGESGGR